MTQYVLMKEMTSTPDPKELMTRVSLVVLKMARVKIIKNIIKAMGKNFCHS